MSMLRRIKLILNNRLLKKDNKLSMDVIEGQYLNYDKSLIQRTNTIKNIPIRKFRTGGKNSYAEWAHVIGIFQTLIYEHLDTLESNKILDIGCGTGLVSMAAQNYVGKGGEYLGIDLNENEINFCKINYKTPNINFKHVEANNAYYSPNGLKNNKPWEIDNNTIDLVTALSVWTHLNETDAIFYFKEVFRVLKPNGKAIITFFCLDDNYTSTLNKRSNEKGKYHCTSQMDWIFNAKAYNSENWFYPDRFDIPESAIGISEEGLNQLLKESGLKLIKHYPGNWKEIPGVFFQDIFVFQKLIDKNDFPST